MENYYEKWLDNNCCIGDEIIICVRDKNVQMEISQMLLDDGKDEVDLNTMLAWEKNTDIEKIAKSHGYYYAEKGVNTDEPNYVYII